MKTHVFGALLATSLVVAGTAACNREEPAQTTQTTTPQTVAQDDGAITTAVQARFYSDEQVRGRNISVVTQDKVVTLRGTVDSEAARDRAVSIARNVEGVTNVNNELQVRTAATATDPADRRADAGPGEDARDVTGTTGYDVNSRQPGWITTKIQAQYFADGDVKGRNIDVTTNNDGVVTLEGEVDNATAKSEAVRIARETDGVTRVEDRLRITGEADARSDAASGIERPDAWLTLKVQSKYFLDDEVKGRNIDVDTQNGVVTLQGVVANESERRQAVALARNTEGVRNVTDNLRVDPTVRDDDTRTDADRDEARRDSKTGAVTREARDAERRMTIERPDAWVTMKIQSKYFLDPQIKGNNIDVTTNEGVVTLRGTVANEALKEQAAQIARDTEGALRIVNELKVGQQDR